MTVAYVPIWIGAVPLICRQAKHDKALNIGVRMKQDDSHVAGRVDTHV